jgi:hypothetical protein
MGAGKSEKSPVWLTLFLALHLVFGAIALGLMLRYVPQCEKVFKDFGVKLPEMTILVFDLSMWVRRSWFLIPVPAACDLALLFWLYETRQTGLLAVWGVLAWLAEVLLIGLILLAILVPTTDMVQHVSKQQPFPEAAGSPDTSDDNDEPRMTVETIVPLVREYAFRDRPALAQGVQFKIEELVVRDLWNTLKVQLFLVHYISLDGQNFDEKSLMYYDGKLTPFGAAFGGYGPMSGVLADKCFYYTWSCGSGRRHRSYVGRLAIEAGQVRILESPAFMDADLFIKSRDGSVQVESGEFLAFNSWKAKGVVGTVKTQGSGLAIVDAKGTPVPRAPVPATPVPATPVPAAPGPKPK